MATVRHYNKTRRAPVPVTFADRFLSDTTADRFIVLLLRRVPNAMADATPLSSGRHRPNDKRARPGRTGQDDVTPFYGDAGVSRCRPDRSARSTRAAAGPDYVDPTERYRVGLPEATFSIEVLAEYDLGGHDLDVFLGVSDVFLTRISMLKAEVDNCI